MKTNYDIIIIGGGLAGLSAAYTSQQFGFEPLILEKFSSLGGGNQTDIDEYGNCFDKGYHALDYGRSPLATKFFQKMLDGKFRKFELKRGVVLKDYLIEYNSPAEQWPPELQKLFSQKTFIDDVKAGDQLNSIAKVYGEEFLKFAKEEVLGSYPHKQWAIDSGAEIEKHFDMVYPWFFPYAERKVERKNEWDFYHDKMRNNTHYMMYPQEGGFQSFVDGIVRNVKKNPHHIELSCEDLEFNFSSDRDHHVSSVKAKGQVYQAPLILWCAPLAQLFKLLKLPLKIDGKPIRIVLGNFVFDKAVNTHYHEVIVGSKNHLINRMSFPGNLTLRQNNLAQVEFTFPDGDFQFGGDEWKEKWLKSLAALGLVNDQKCTNFTFKNEVRGFATKQDFVFVLNDIKEQLSKVRTNLELPFPMVGVENINRVVPETIMSVVKLLNKQG